MPECGLSGCIQGPKNTMVEAGGIEGKMHIGQPGTLAAQPSTTSVICCDF